MKDTRVEVLELKKIKPYRRNPKTGQNVEQVKVSIQEFGYNQYIVVDKNYVIVAWHSRYKALMELGYSTIPVIVTDLDKQEAKKYRILDNKVAEYNMRDDKELWIELREFINDDTMKQFYDMTQFEWMETTSQQAKDVTSMEVDRAQNKLKEQFADLWVKRQDNPLMVCPECWHEFRVW